MGAKSKTQPKTDLTFGDAIEALKQGSSVTRAAWRGKGAIVYFVEASGDPDVGDDIQPDEDHLAMKSGSRTIANWLPSQSDMLANDWQIV